ncbi:hypothetical protein Tco_0281339, partial [Tanacetum coccineum]
DVFETTLPPAPAAGADAQALADWVVLFYRHNEVACLMLGTIIKRNKQPIVGASSTSQVMAIQGGRVQKYKPQGKAKGKGKGRTLEKDTVPVVLDDWDLEEQQKSDAYSSLYFTCGPLVCARKWKAYWKFWTLESAARISILFQTKKVGQDPYETIGMEKFPKFVLLIRFTLRSGLCFNVEVEEHSLGDLNEPANYKAALSDPKFEKWIYKKKTDMDDKLYRRHSLTMRMATWTVDSVLPNVPYASVVGSIMYVVRCTRPDVAFVQNITSHFQQNSGEAHWTAVKNILKY